MASTERPLEALAERRFERPPGFDTPRALAARKLGKAVHPAALDRLFELYPEAVVGVQHRHEPAPGRLQTQKMDCHHECRQHITVVAIEYQKSYATFGHAFCHPDDNWDRRKGIEIAFRRALKEVPR